MKLRRVIDNPFRIFSALASRGWFRRMEDERYVRLLYRSQMGKKLDLEAPKTYNEKLQWLKLYDRRPEYIPLVDKYAVREHIAKTVGEEYLVPLVGGPWDSFSEIDFDKLPRQFVLKCTHDSGGLVICRDKASLDREKAREKIEKCQRRNYCDFSREWPYKHVKPRIIAEAYLEDSVTKELRDYKFFAFDGRVKLLFVASERQKEGAETKFDFFDMDYNHLELINGHPNAAVTPEKPAGFEKMKALAEKLSRGIPHVRVDFYEVDGKVYFGELTLFHWSGIVPFEPASWDETLGSWIKLPPKREEK